MSGKRKKEFVKNPDRHLRKKKKIMVRFPKRSLAKVKELMKKYDVKGIQALFDILIIGGVVFKKTDILEYIRKQVPKYKEFNRQVNLARLGKVEKPETPDMYGTTLAMYLSDYTTFKEYVVEENIKQQWVFSILFEDGFANEEQVIIDLIRRSQKLDISNRKKAIARLTKDEYIAVLPTAEAQLILDQVTKEYDERTFDDSMEAEIEARLQLKQKLREEQEEQELDDELNNKLNSIRRSRNVELTKIIAPNLEID